MADKVYTLPELKKKLTEKERIFCHQYIIDWNGARSAREAGYSEKTCYVIASENLTKPHIKQYIDFIKDDYEKEAGISKLKNLHELAKIAYSSIDHLHDTWIEKKEFEDLVKENPNILACIQSIESSVEKKNIGGRNKGNQLIVDVEVVKLKLYSKLQAIGMINEMMGYKEAQKVEHSGSIDDVSKIPTKELVERASAIKTINESKG